ncbi:MAG: hypothetical protein QW074_07780 [Candidatus Caldarchaeum sp.]
MRKAPLALLAAVILVQPLILPVQGQDIGYSFRLERLTISADLYAVDVAAQKVVAVGKSGAVVVWGGGRADALTVASSDLFSVACGRLCVAVGRSGTVVEIDPETLSFVTYRPATMDYKAVRLSGDRFYILGDQSVTVYRAGGVVERTVYTGWKLSSIAPAGDRVYAASGSKLLSIDVASGEVSTVADLKAAIRQIYVFAGKVWALTERGLMNGENLVQQGAFAFMKPHPRGFLLAQGQSILLYDIYDRKLSTLVNLDQSPTDLVLQGSSIMAVGYKGYAAAVSENGVRRVFAPSLRYVDAVTDGGGTAYIAAEDGTFLIYRSGFFTSYSLGDNIRSVAFSLGKVAVLGRELWVFDGTGFRPAAADVRATDFYDMAPSRRPGYWLTLVGKGGRVADVSENGEVKVVSATSADLYSVSGGFAVGDKVAVRLGDEPRVAKMSGRMVNVVDTACGGIAVGDSGQIAYLLQDEIRSTSFGKTRFTAASINPRGAYALLATSGGELVLYDGFNATLLPIAVPEAVRAVAWLSSREALVVTSGSIYRLVEESYPPSRLEASAPKGLEVFAGSSRDIRVELTPRNGFSGKVEIQLWVTGMPGYVSTNPSTVQVSVTPLCKTMVQFRVSAYPEAREGAASIIMRMGDTVLATIPIAVKRPGQPQSSGPIQVPALMDLILLAGMVVAAAGFGAVFARRMRGGRMRRKRVEEGVEEV